MGSLHTFFLSENTNLCVHLSCSENTSSLRTAYRSQRLFMRCIKKVISHPLRRPSSQNRDRFAGSRFCFLIWRLIHRAPNRIGDAFLIHLRFMFLIRLDRRFPGHTRLSEQSAPAGFHTPRSTISPRRALDSSVGQRSIVRPQAADRILSIPSFIPRISKIIN